MKEKNEKAGLKLNIQKIKKWGKEYTLRSYQSIAILEFLANVVFLILSTRQYSSWLLVLHMGC